MNKEKITGYSLLEKMEEPELAQFVPPVKDKTERRCEKCKYYSAIDSAYGYCLRFPPKMRKEKWWKNKWVIEYPIVEWCRKGCGEFILKLPFLESQEQDRQEAYERGYEMGSKMNIPTKKALENARQKAKQEERERIRWKIVDWADRKDPPIDVTGLLDKILLFQ